jgi:branched-subunit amino acid ABC-type transport system permease component
VLIFKASGVFNFAQGAMVLFAAPGHGALPNGFRSGRAWSKVLANLLAFVVRRC